MARLTHERCNGIKTGYWSAANKEEVVQKLGRIEETAPKLLAAVCNIDCIWHAETPGKCEKCTLCPVSALTKLIDG